MTEQTIGQIIHLRLPGSLAQNQFADLFERAVAQVENGLLAAIFIQELPGLEEPGLAVYPFYSQHAVPVLAARLLRAASAYYGWSDQDAMWKLLKAGQRFSILEKPLLPDMIEADIARSWLIRFGQRECVVARYTEGTSSSEGNEDEYTIWEQYEG